MDIQETIDIRYEEIEGLKQKLSEDHYMNPEQEDELVELIDKAIKFGELCAQRDAKSQGVPEGFVLVKDKPVAYMVQNKFWNGEFEVKLLSEMPEPVFDGDSYDIEIPLYAIEAQEQAND